MSNIVTPGPAQHMSTTTHAHETSSRRKADRCAVELGNTRSHGLHELWTRLYGQECHGAGQCGLSAIMWPTWEAELEAKRARRRVHAAVESVGRKACPMP